MNTRRERIVIAIVGVIAILGASVGSIIFTWRANTEAEILDSIFTIRVPDLSLLLHENEEVRGRALMNLDFSASKLTDEQVGIILGYVCADLIDPIHIETVRSIVMRRQDDFERMMVAAVCDKSFFRCGQSRLLLKWIARIDPKYDDIVSAKSAEEACEVATGIYEGRQRRNNYIDDDEL